jgi:hypothetical protein
MQRVNGILGLEGAMFVRTNASQNKETIVHLQHVIEDELEGLRILLAQVRKEDPDLFREEEPIFKIRDQTL